jgi:hypothetical protein
MGGFQLMKLNDVWISNRFAALENLHDDLDINRPLETIRENIKISAKRVQVIEET